MAESTKFIVPAPQHFSDDNVGKQRARIRSAVRSALDYEGPREALSTWKWVGGHTKGLTAADDIACWEELVKSAPENIAKELTIGDFKAWDRAKMMNSVLRCFYTFENGKMTGDLLLIEAKPNSEANAPAFDPFADVVGEMA